MPANERRASSFPPNQRQSVAPSLPGAVLIDGTSLFFSCKALWPDSQFSYPRFVQLLCDVVPGVSQPSLGPHGSIWTFWTAAEHANVGQVRFLTMLETDLRWDVRRFSPAESYLVDPMMGLGVASDSRVGTRLMRFDAAIAFAMGRLADRPLVVVSDSFGLCEPLLKSAAVRKAPNTLAFFGRALDPRWQRVLHGKHEFMPTFVDLDDHEETLFGRPATLRPEGGGKFDGRIVF